MNLRCVRHKYTNLPNSNCLFPFLIISKVWKGVNICSGKTKRISYNHSRCLKDSINLGQPLSFLIFLKFPTLESKIRKP